jgi:hypothetical protein
MQHIVGVLLDPMPLVHRMPFAGDGLKRRSAVGDDLQSPKSLLDGWVLALPQQPLGVRRRFTRVGATDRRIGADREQFLLALELIPETPQLAARRRECQSIPIER